MDWRIKAVIQQVLGRVPFGQEVHTRLQRSVGGLTNFNRECDIKVDDWRIMMGHLRAASVPIREATFLEIGTGWYPTFPLCLHLAGAPRIMTYDLHRHLAPDLVIALADRLALHAPLIATASGKSVTTVGRQQWKVANALRDGASLAAATGSAIDYRAPGDAASTNLAANSVDVVFSNSVLEHVPPSVIEAMFAEAKRILRPGGIMFHSVNCGDHYAYVDTSIHQLHYLQFSDQEWTRWNNSFLYQNRLRACDFTEMAKEAGFAIELDTSCAKPDRLAQIDALRVHASFKARYTREQLAITSIDFIARKAREIDDARLS